MCGAPAAAGPIAGRVGLLSFLITTGFISKIIFFPVVLRVGAQRENGLELEAASVTVRNLTLRLASEINPGQHTACQRES